MKVQYDEEQMQTMGIILDRLEVRGVDQARLLVTLDNVMKKGRRIEEGSCHGSGKCAELLQAED